MKTCPVCGKEYSNTSTLCPIDAAVLQQTSDPLIGQKLAGKYLIEELIKRGGMGAVYRGKHVLMDKTVAIKVLRPALAVDDDVVARFSREAKAASRISHPHAVSVNDFGEDENGVVFLVMEYLDGRTLKQVIKSDGPLPLDRSVEIIRQVAGALDSAHEQGVVHRDLKSDNIMLLQTNGADWAKVLDFGIAKIQQTESFRDPDITAPNLVIGTPQYMSPEQCAHSGPVDARSDNYSLGIIAYEMLAGRVPFAGDSATVIMMKQVQDEPSSILEARPNLPPAVARVIARSLAKQPADRFQTAGEFASALAEASLSRSREHEQIFAAPITTPNAPIASAQDDLDEITLVRQQPVDEITAIQPQRAPGYASRSTDDARMAPPAVLRDTNPWRIMIPAVIVLLAVFGVVFLLTRGSQSPTTNANPSGNANQPGLFADPNSQPVQPAGTPTGESERDIQARPSASVTPAQRTTNANSEPATVVGEFGTNANSNASARGRNANPRELPTPRLSPTVEPENPTPTPRRPRPTPSLSEVVKPKATPSP